MLGIGEEAVDAGGSAASPMAFLRRVMFADLSSSVARLSLIHLLLRYILLYISIAASRIMNISPRLQDALETLAG